MKILAISDKVVPIIYSPQVKDKFNHVDMVIACGDLPYYYQEFIVSSLNKPFFFVRGNHDPVREYGENTVLDHPGGGIDLHRRFCRYNRILLAGIEGSIRYNRQSAFQYTQNQMWSHVFSLVPRLVYNRLRYGRFIDIFVTHAPPWEIHDREDRPHHGIKAFRWLIETFKPGLHFHGHIHVYRPDTIIETQFKATRVLNAYRYIEVDFNI